MSEIPGPGKYEYKNLNSGPKYGFSNDPKFKNIKNVTPGPNHYHIPCSIRDVPTFVRNPNPAFLKEYTFI